MVNMSYMRAWGIKDADARIYGFRVPEEVPTVGDRGVFGGGYDSTPVNVNIIDYITIS